jgi:hypothetical protein
MFICMLLLSSMLSILLNNLGINRKSGHKRHWINNNYYVLFIIYV